MGLTKKHQNEIDVNFLRRLLLQDLLALEHKEYRWTIERVLVGNICSQSVASKGCAMEDVFLSKYPSYT